jgi:membrane AbrB-like protein
VPLSGTVPDAQPGIQRRQFLQKAARTLCTLAAGTAGGYGFRALGIPAGAIVGAIVFVSAANIVFQKIFIPGWLRSFIQICAGSYIGSQITRHALLSVRELIVPMIIVVAGVFAMSFVTAYVIHKASDLDFVTCLYSSIPGGLAEMSLIAQDMGLDTPKIVVMHTAVWSL